MCPTFSYIHLFEVVSIGFGPLHIEPCIACYRTPKYLQCSFRPGLPQNLDQDVGIYAGLPIYGDGMAEVYNEHAKITLYQAHGWCGPRLIGGYVA